jgi:hypothetical protein
VLAAAADDLGRHVNRSKDASFAAGVVSACAPLAVWALFFFGAYAAVAAGCQQGVDAQWLRGGLVVAGLLALAFAVVWLVRACRALRRDRGLLAKARLACALLAAIGIGWMLVPALLLAPCPVPISAAPRTFEALPAPPPARAASSATSPRRATHRA